MNKFNTLLILTASLVVAMPSFGMRIAADAAERLPIVPALHNKSFSTMNERSLNKMASLFWDATYSPQDFAKELKQYKANHPDETFEKLSSQCWDRYKKRTMIVQSLAQIKKYSLAAGALYAASKFEFDSPAKDALILLEGTVGAYIGATIAHKAAQIGVFHLSADKWANREKKWEFLNLLQIDKLGRTQIMLGIEKNQDPKMIQELVDAGVDINHKNEYNGATALHLALIYYSDNPKYLEELLRCGANVNCQNKYGQTPLMHACSYRSTQDPLNALLQANPDLDMRDHSGMTALMQAAYEVNLNAVKVLLEREADLSLQSDNGFNALCWAMHAKPRTVRLYSNEYNQLMELLIAEHQKKGLMNYSQTQEYIKSKGSVERPKKKSEQSSSSSIQTVASDSDCDLLLMQQNMLNQQRLYGHRDIHGGSYDRDWSDDSDYSSDSWDSDFGDSDGGGGGGD